jgi:hypothetical protein
MSEYSYIIEEDNEQFGLTIYKNGEMLPYCIDWFDDYDSAYNYMRNEMKELGVK